MKVLILGHRGMLGHMASLYLEKFFEVETIESRYPEEQFKKDILKSDADFMINCIGAIPQKTKEFSINSDLPVWLDSNFSGKIIHPGTDCEMDEDEYGTSKRLAAEWIVNQGIRTKIIKGSIIGPEIRDKKSLLEWFLSNPDGSTVKGYANHYWNGVTTLAWSKQAKLIIEEWDKYGTVTIVGSDKSSKYDILSYINEIYNRDIKIERFFTENAVNKCLEKDVDFGKIYDLIVDSKNFYERNETMVRVDSFAACFFATDEETIAKQLEIIEDLERNYGYPIERWYRKERNPDYYNSFSQMVNDAIDDTDSEFMIMFNPKTLITKEMFLETIEKLESGYCFVSLVSFGFFAFSKELIREIGMFDERFLFGEFEDDDFSLRLGNFGKAVWFEHRKDRYQISEISKISYPGIMKGISGSAFLEKYSPLENGSFITSREIFNKSKKISKRHSKKNYNIIRSWKGSGDSYSDGCRHGNYASKNLIVFDESVDSIKKATGKKSISVLINLRNLDNGISDFRIAYNTDSEKPIFFKISKPHYLGGDYIYSSKILPNHWLAARTSQHGREDLPMYNGDTEVRLFWSGSQIYHGILDFGKEHRLSFNL